MTDRNVLIGSVIDGFVQHEQELWQQGNDRLVDPEGRPLALLADVGTPDLPLTSTFYVDPHRTDSYTEDGSLTRPFKSPQAALDAVAAFSSANSGSYITLAIVLAPGDYALEGLDFDPLVLDLPDNPSHSIRLALIGSSNAGANVTNLPPLDIQLPGSTNRSVLVAIRDCEFYTDTEHGLKITDHATYTGVCRIYLHNVQIHTGQDGEHGLWITNAEGVGGGNIQVHATARLLINAATDDGDAKTATAVRLDRGQFIAQQASLYGRNAPAVIAAAGTRVDVTGGYWAISGTTAGPHNLVEAAGNATVTLSEITTQPKGAGHAVVHNGTFDGTGGWVSARNLTHLNGGATTGISAPSGALVSHANIVNELGQPLAVTVTDPQLLVRSLRGANVGYTDSTDDGNGNSLWATTAPETLEQAINRLATHVAGHLGTPIPE